VLSNDEIIQADMVIMGTGAKPCTGFMKDTGIKFSEDGGIIVNEYMQTNYKDIFAAGDLA
jgi:NAD(P)H-nitrite reductase large subunit